MFAQRKSSIINVELQPDQEKKVEVDWSEEEDEEEEDEQDIFGEPPDKKPKKKFMNDIAR